MTTDREVTQLLIGHTHADHIFTALRGAVKVKDRAAVEAHFRTLEKEMLRHMADEERLLLPDYDLADRDDTALLRADHLRIRALLKDACALASQEEIDEARLREIVNVLLAHHGHEETGLYRWARARASGPELPFTN